MEVRVGLATVTIHGDDQFLVCERNGEMAPAAEQGCFAPDTGLASGYRLALGRARPVLGIASEVQRYTARFEFTGSPDLQATGQQVPEHDLHLRLDRTIGNLDGRTAISTLN